MADKAKAFFIMPFEQDFFDLYEEFKKRFGETFDFSHAGDLDNQQNIIKDIVVGIAKADIIIADLTGLNPNVFYELGIAHSMDKKTIIITQNIDDLPFDIRSYRANEYSLKFNKIPIFMKEMEKLLNGAMDGSVNYGNPVKDFASKSTAIVETPVRGKAIETKNSDEEQVDDESDFGFLDYITNIEERGALILNEVIAIKDGLNAVSSETSKATVEINRVKTKGGKIDPVFAQNVCKKLAVPVNKYASDLTGHVQVISENWDSIENSYFGLLDNPFMKTTENIKELQSSNDKLKEMQAALKTSKAATESLIFSLSGSIGVERKLTKSIRLLQDGLSSYLSLTDKMFASIDRILTRSELIINGQ